VRDSWDENRRVVIAIIVSVFLFFAVPMYVNLHVRGGVPIGRTVRDIVISVGAAVLAGWLFLSIYGAFRRR
jgi:hypothetical protein